MIFGITSYLPEDEHLRCKRLKGHRKQLEFFREVLPDVPIYVVAQNYKDTDYTIDDKIHYLVFESGIGPANARNELLKLFYNSNEDFMYMLDDDIVFYDCLNVAGCMAREVKDYLAVRKNARYSPADGVCSMIFKNLYITYDGYLTMCCTDFQNYLVVADLKNENLADAWNNQYAQNLRKAHLSHKLEGTLCYNCINNCVEEIVPLREEYATRVDVKKWDKSLEIERRIAKYQSGQ